MCETLIVKVFEVNTLNYYLAARCQEVSTDLDLDGLVTNHERTINYKEAPQRRDRPRVRLSRTIEKRRGVWVIEFIGGSKSSRAVIRKGALQVLSRTSTVGEVLTVLDEQHRPEPGAAVWFGGRRIACDEEGRALIPFSTDPGSRTGVVETSSGFASLTRFQHPGERYAWTPASRSIARPCGPAPRPPSSCGPPSPSRASRSRWNGSRRCASS